MNFENIYTLENTSKKLYEASQLLTMISSTRSVDYSSWIKIGSVLYHLSNGNQEGLDVWIYFSKREQDCILSWSKVSVSCHTIHVLYHYAKMDHTKAFTDYKNTNCKNKFAQLVRCNGYDLLEVDYAEMLHVLYKDEFFYHDGWYHWEEKKWTFTKECIELQQYVATLKLFIDMEVKLLRREVDRMNHDIREQEELDTNTELILDLINAKQEVEGKLQALLDSKKRFRKMSFINSIMRACKMLFLDKTVLGNPTEYELTKNITIISPIKSFVRYLIMDETYQDDIIRLSSTELLFKFNEFIQKSGIIYDMNSISLNIQLKNLHIKGITSGIHTKNGNKTEFIKSLITCSLHD